MTAFPHPAFASLTSALSRRERVSLVALLFLLLSSSPAFAAAPTIASVSPNSGSVYGSQTITITGNDFLGATAVVIGGVGATSYSVISNTEIRATLPTSVPPAVVHAAGAVSVDVTTPSGTNAANLLYTFAVDNPAVQVTVRVTIPHKADIQWGNGTSIDDALVDHTLPANRISAYTWIVQDSDLGSSLSTNTLYLTNDAANSKTINVSNISQTNATLTITAIATNTAAWTVAPAAGVNAFRMRAKMGAGAFTTLGTTSVALTALLVKGTDQALVLELNTPTQGIAAVQQQTTVQLTAVPN